MRIHTDKLTTGDFYDAAKVAGVTISSNSMHNSRSRDHAFDFSLRGSSARYPMGGNDGTGKSATWDEWGVFLAHLFSIDPDARVANVYEGKESFDYKTFARFDNGKPSDMHGDHRWDYHAPFTQACGKCSAKSRHK